MPSVDYRVSLRHRAGPLDLDVDFVLHSPWTVLFAPSGAGKTTILRMIAGLDRPTAGRIASNGTTWLDTVAGVSLPAHKRRIRMVAQRPAIFPHLSVLGNISYGEAPQNSGKASLVSGERFREILDLCRVSHLAGRRPHQLSGGERQRVALARTLASFPANLLLLDEPFTGLEAALRDVLICDLRAYTMQREVPVLLVTHDIGEVFAAKAHVLKMEAGRLVASGPAHEVLAAERISLLTRLEAQDAHE